MSDIQQNPFPDGWDLVWTALQMVGMPFLVLLPAMLLLSLVDIYNKARSVSAGFRSASEYGSRKLLRLNEIEVFRFGLLAVAQSAVVAAVYCTFLLARLSFVHVSDDTPLGGLLHEAWGDPVGQGIAAKAALLVTGFALAFDVAIVRRSQIVKKIAASPWWVLMIAGSLVALGSALSALVVWLYNDMTANVNVWQSLGMAITGAVAWLMAGISLELADRASAAPE